MTQPTNSQSLLHDAIVRHLPYEPNSGQRVLIDMLSSFATSNDNRSVFLLKGYAGTGKTSLTAALVNALHELKHPTVLMAPTGRAAKVFSNFAGRKAYTIHKSIFRHSALEAAPTSFQLAENKERNTLFIVDEASMIGDGGSMPLLDCLLRYIYSGYGCRAILIGDTAQLPPVGQGNSPAMNMDTLRKYGLTPLSFELQEPVRQARESGILYNATRLRMLLEHQSKKMPHLKVSGFEDIEILPSDYLMERVEDSYSEVGKDNTLLITRSNKMAGLINQAVRGRVLYGDEELMRDERLVIAKNNYYWSRQNKGLSFIANGESINLEWHGNLETKYNHRFMDVDFHLDGREDVYSAKIILDSLINDTPSLSQHEMQALFETIYSDTDSYPEEPVTNGATELSRRIKILHTDPYLNALQVKYAYCMTCHKAQGGQWKHVYIDLSYLNPDLAITDFLRWLYTAITRASEKVFLINPSIPCD